MSNFENAKVNAKGYQVKPKILTTIIQYLAWGGAIVSLILGFLFAFMPEPIAKLMQNIGLLSIGFDAVQMNYSNKIVIFLFIIIALLCYAIYRIYRTKAKQEVGQAIAEKVKEEL
ncbi:MAG: hypothetical protein LBH92_03185 [Bacteroidales bacterium]|jgi:hypothetical protein|nr:hypothetical protein [Bacteroidales bacterium]